jgi:hypothetical protein
VAQAYVSLINLWCITLGSLITYRPNQLFLPHIHILDFILWPAFREFTVEILEMQEHMEYMMDMSNSLRCDWYFAKMEALKNVEETGMIDLCDLAKVRSKERCSFLVL